MYLLDPTVRILNGGRVLVGGSPLTVMRLSERGADVLAGLTGAGPEVAVERARSEVARFADRLVEAGILVPTATPGGGPFHPADVTVVVPVLGRPDLLDRCLTALGELSEERPGRVVVVDDGTPGAQRGALAEVASRHGADLVRREVNGGPAATRNSGLAAVGSGVVAFVDADVEVQEGWLDRTLPHLADPRVGIVAPRVVTPLRGARPSLLARFEHVRSPLDLGPLPGPVRARSRVAYVPAATLVCRTGVLEALEGFDERLRVGEDVDLVWRCQSSEGARVWFTGDEARVEHRGERQGPGWLRRRFDYGTSAAALDERHPGSVAPLGVSGWSVAVWVALAARRPFVAAGLGVGTTFALARKLSFLEHAPGEAIRLTARGHSGAGEAIGRALIRPWWPLLFGAGLVSRRARRLGVLAVVAPALVEWRRRRPPLDPVSWVGMCLIDDVAYSAGVWTGCARTGSFRALRPALRDWPGRTGVVTG